MKNIFEKGNVNCSRLNTSVNENYAYSLWRNIHVYFKDGIEHNERKDYKMAATKFATSYNLAVHIRNISIVEQNMECPQSSVKAIHKAIFNLAMFYAAAELDHNVQTEIHLIDILNDFEQLRTDCALEIASLNNPNYLKWFEEWIIEKENGVKDYFKYEDPEGFKIYSILRNLQKELKIELLNDEHKKVEISKNKNQLLTDMLEKRPKLSYPLMDYKRD